MKFNVGDKVQVISAEAALATGRQRNAQGEVHMTTTRGFTWVIFPEGAMIPFRAEEISLVGTCNPGRAAA